MLRFIDRYSWVVMLTLPTNKKLFFGNYIDGKLSYTSTMRVAINDSSWSFFGSEGYDITYDGYDFHIEKD